MDDLAMAQPAHQSSKDQESFTTIQDDETGDPLQRFTIVGRSPNYTASWTKRRLEAIKALHRTGIEVQKSKAHMSVRNIRYTFGR